METYYGKPIEYGCGVRLVTAWESSGCLHHNPRCLIFRDGQQVQQYEFWQPKEAMRFASDLFFQAAKEARMSSQGPAFTPG